MKYIVIVSVPPGQAPLWVRERWVGVSIPLIIHPRNDLPKGGILGGPSCNSGGYVVAASTAIDRLKQVAPAAAKWWQQHLPLPSRSELVFGRHVCRISESASAKRRH